MNKKKILGIDTCMGACSVAVYDPISGSSYACSEMIQYGHAERLMTMVQEVMAQAQALPEDIELVAVTKGPGAFTGMRTGISAAKAYAMALGVPVVGVCSFDALMETYKSKSDALKGMCYAVVIDTRRNDFYFQAYDGAFAPVPEAGCFSFEQIAEKIGLAEVIFIGDACAGISVQMTRIQREFKVHDLMAADPMCVARLGQKLYAGKSQSEDFTPVYLRAPDVSIAKSAVKT